MDRPKHWGLVVSGVALLSMTAGCRSTRSKVPAPPAADAPTQAQFSSYPPPATGPSGINGPMGMGGGINASVMPGQAPGMMHNDVPASGLGSPTPTAPSPGMMQGGPSDSSPSPNLGGMPGGQ